MPTRTGATIGVISPMIPSFAGWSSGMSRSAESTSETEGSRSNAAAFRRSSARDAAVERALNPERPAARMRFSQTTDSVPRACRFSRL